MSSESIHTMMEFYVRQDGWSTADVHGKDAMRETPGRRVCNN